MGLPISYQRAFDAESRDYEMPIILNTPTFTICAATILDTGTDGQKRDRISAAIRGDEVLVQLLSEPSGGSDLAGVITRADRRGEKWIVNSAKTWSTSAFAADYGLLLARTDWNVRKHEGLTMFLVPINSPGITMRRIMQVDGGNEFASGTGAEGASDQPVDYVALLEATGQTDNERIREQAGRALVHRAVQKQLVDHVYHGVLDGSLPPAAGSIIRITTPRPFSSRSTPRWPLRAPVAWSTTEPACFPTAITPPARAPHSAAVPQRSRATSSASASWASPVSTLLTVACPSIG
jgi:hypothetical protein